LIANLKPQNQRRANKNFLPPISSQINSFKFSRLFSRYIASKRQQEIINYPHAKPRKTVFIYPKSNGSEQILPIAPLNLEVSFDFASSKTKFSAVKVRVFSGKRVNFTDTGGREFDPKHVSNSKRSKF